jgi:hypothetical protein
LLDVWQESSEFYLNQKTKQISVAWNHKRCKKIFKTERWNEISTT